MTKEEQQFNQWFDEYANGIKVFEEADMKQAYLQGRAELEKENAELKEKLGNVQMQKAGEKSDLVWKLKTANEQKADQLNNAKEIIKGLKAHLDLSDCVNNDYRLQLLKQAEQFLSEVE